MDMAPKSFHMTRAISAIVLSLIIAFALNAYVVRKSTKRPASIFWCTNTGSYDTDGPCRFIKEERAI